MGEHRGAVGARANRRAHSARTRCQRALAAATPIRPANTVTDPAGDVADARGDITAAGFSQESGSVAFGVKVKSAVNPRTDAGWEAGLPLVAWALDTNHDGTPEYIAVLGSDPGGNLQAELGSLSDGSFCAGTGHFIAGYGYTAQFASHCLTPGLSFQFQAVMTYTTDPSDMNAPIDVAPNNGYSPTLVTSTSAGSDGYWMLGADGRVYAFGGAIGFSGLVPFAAAMAPRQDGRGYWITDIAGHVFARRDRGLPRRIAGAEPGRAHHDDRRDPDRQRLLAVLESRPRVQVR